MESTAAKQAFPIARVAIFMKELDCAARVNIARVSAINKKSHATANMSISPAGMENSVHSYFRKPKGLKTTTERGGQPTVAISTDESQNNFCHWRSIKGPNEPMKRKNKQRVPVVKRIPSI